MLSEGGAHRWMVIAWGTTSTSLLTVGCQRLKTWLLRKVISKPHHHNRRLFNCLPASLLTPLFSKLEVVLPLQQFWLIDWLIDRWIDRWIDGWMDGSIDRSIHPSIHRLIHRSIDPSVHPSVNQSINQSINQSKLLKQQNYFKFRK